MSPILSFFKLDHAMKQPGCPICYLRNVHEKDLLEDMLLNHVTDGEIAVNIAASLGFCPKHTWEMGLLDLATYEEPVKNGMVYETLVKKTLHKLITYRQKEEAREHGINREYRRLFRKEHPAAFEQEPFAQMTVKVCYVCQVGEEEENFFLRSLIEGFGEESSETRERYLASDGLCLRHFRKAFAFGNPELSRDMRFLLEATIQKLTSLGGDLTNFIDKHSWDRRHEELSQGERTSWKRALRFFGANEENLLSQNWASSRSEVKPREYNE